MPLSGLGLLMTFDLKNKVALITGASSGIGQAVAYQLAQMGVRLILTARRAERLALIAKDLKSKFNADVLPLELDVRDKLQVGSQIQSLPNDWKDVYLLLNNAGLALESVTVQEGKTDNWDQMIDTNIKGLLYMTRAILPLMLEKKQGHIINIGSIAGHECYPAGNIYCATKHAVKALNQSMQIDLLGTGLRVSEVDPGAVHTEFSEVRWSDKQKSDAFYSTFTPLTADDVADSIIYCATRPLHANVAQLILMPTVQASCNHIYKEGLGSKSLFDSK
jgi:3-hydroxy acid dehydrogenase/malonic semialdehyde reductase